MLESLICGMRGLWTCWQLQQQRWQAARRINRACCRCGGTREGGRRGMMHLHAVMTLIQNQPGVVRITWEAYGPSGLLRCQAGLCGRELLKSCDRVDDSRDPWCGHAACSTLSFELFTVVRCAHLPTVRILYLFSGDTLLLLPVSEPQAKIINKGQQFSSRLYLMCATCSGTNV